ncbi:MAG TPA: discoidin domain-containing protein, partial [Bacteroidota bacterium]|nr:discoidin domain-containing protein [Bacteroidota bacterium]
KGKIFIDNFRFESIDDDAARIARADVDASSMSKGGEPTIDEKGTFLANWRGTNEQEWLSINFNYLKEIGGLVIDWDSIDYASSYEVQLSDDGKDWASVYTVANGNGGRDYIYLPEKDARVLRINFTGSRNGKGYRIARLEVKGPEFSSSANDFFAAIAGESPKGLFPKYFLKQQCYWTIVGTSGDTKEALINELGTIEVDKLRFSLEPFLFVGNKLVTWNDVSTEPSLENRYLPIPSVKWKSGGMELTVRAFSAGVAGNSALIATYTIENKGSTPSKGRLFIALRPFQVNPPWQWLNNPGGAARIDSIRYENGFIHVQDKTVIPISQPAAFGATNFDSGDIVEYLQNGAMPSSQNARDANGFASGALKYDFDVPSGASREFHIVVPFHAWNGSPTPNMGDGADIYVNLAHSATVQFWESKLDKVHITLPESAQPVINTVKSNLAWIFINRDGPGIQPGSRSYERSWIRDGSLTSTALLELGVKNEVKQYIDWYSGYQLPGGKIPCVVDGRGADPTAEHDSHGEYIYAVMQYYNFTGDTVWLRTKFEHVVKTVRYIQSLRAERKSDVYKHGTPEQRACYGLVPESISHEGYSAKPMHSYWDDFFILRGLKDAASIAGILGEQKLAGEFAAERDDFRKDLYASMRIAMSNKNVDYIPGCVELGDFDATSTTIGIHPANELGNPARGQAGIPEPQLHNTFEKYYDYFTERKDGKIAWEAYTPYENRVIGSFVFLDQKERAHEALNFFMKDRRPSAWNQWAEVVHRDPAAPKFIGDMPHTWCGSDFIRSVRAMFVYEREDDTSLVVGAGLADAWVNDTAGIHVRNLPTYYGDISYDVMAAANKVSVVLRGDVRVPPGRIILKSPLSKKFTGATIDRKRLRKVNGKEIVIHRLPALIELTY